jgi:hypothetical protein
LQAGRQDYEEICRDEVFFVLLLYDMPRYSDLIDPKKVRAQDQRDCLLGFGIGSVWMLGELMSSVGLSLVHVKVSLSLARLSFASTKMAAVRTRFALLGPSGHATRAATFQLTAS